ncbi:hypothetical protein B0H10DRAFT_1938037 [Mycena sp. CBHHK59/15]|nr:hypothetical protein B0H10DRAFT_1938037 [Mycena sp. CBHHK59/15]
MSKRSWLYSEGPEEPVAKRHSPSCIVFPEPVNQDFLKEVPRTFERCPPRHVEMFDHLSSLTFDEQCQWLQSLNIYLCRHPIQLDPVWDSLAAMVHPHFMHLPLEILHMIFVMVIPPDYLLNPSLSVGHSSAWCSSMVTKRLLILVSKYWYKLCPTLTSINHLPPIPLPVPYVFPILPLTITTLKFRLYDKPSSVRDALMHLCGSLKSLFVYAMDDEEFNNIQLTFPCLNTLYLALHGTASVQTFGTKWAMPQLKQLMLQVSSRHTLKYTTLLPGYEQFLGKIYQGSFTGKEVHENMSISFPGLWIVQYQKSGLIILAYQVERERWDVLEDSTTDLVTEDDLETIPNFPDNVSEPWLQDKSDGDSEDSWFSLESGDETALDDEFYIKDWEMD